jgi:hypothetical protein
MEDEEAVLRAFFRDGRLTEIPTKAGKRRIVLERVALEFEPGRRYDEREVNAIVGAFFEDHAALRRHLVVEGFLDRKPACTGGRAAASTCRRGRPHPDRVRAEPPGGTFPSAVPSVHDEMMP